MKKVKGRNALGGFALGVATTLGAVVGLSGIGDAEAVERSSFGREGFHEALDAVLDRYVDPVDEPRLLARGLKHVVAGLDPHSHYLTAKERKALRRRARGGRSGLAVMMKTDADVASKGRTRRLEVVAVETGSPAAGADIEAGDHILAVRGHEVEDLLSQAEAEALLLGAVGERIEITVQRRKDPAPRTLQLELSAHHADRMGAELVEVGAGKKVAHVIIEAFRRGTGQRVKKALASLERAAGARGLSGIVLDVRGNPGGEVDEALIVADLFVDDGVLTRTRGRGGRILREEKAHAAGTDERTPLVVLQDRHSASASELLAVALSEHGRATVVGERSYGKGTVQEVRGLPDGSVLTLTIARYYSPQDRVIDGLGVAPDVRVEDLDPAGRKGNRGLEAAIDALGLGARSP